MNDSPSSASPQSTFGQFYEKRWGILFAVLLVIFLGTMYRAEGWFVLNYACGIALGWMLWKWITRKASAPWVAPVSLLLLAMLAVCYVYFDGYTTYWSKPNENDPELSIRYQDKYWRHGTFPYLRKMDYHDNGWNFIELSFSDSGKFHGRYKHWVIGAEDKTPYFARGFEDDLLGPHQTKWYWYDEEISEGEWHLRNK